MIELSSNKKEPLKTDSFIRWQGRTMDELGKTINLLLSLSLATIGFLLSKFLDDNYNFKNRGIEIIAFVGVCILLLGIIILLLLIYNRLFSFRKTTEIARKREKNDRTNIEKLRLNVSCKDKLTWKLFKIAILSFSIGEVLVITAFIIEILKHIWK